MCVQVTKTANQFEISSLLEKILLKQVRWCLTFVRLYIYTEMENFSNFQFCLSQGMYLYFTILTIFSLVPVIYPLM